MTFYEKKCVICGKLYIAHSRNGRTCGKECRTELNRQRALDRYYNYHGHGIYAVVKEMAAKLHTNVYTIIDKIGLKKAREMVAQGITSVTLP